MPAPPIDSRPPARRRLWPKRKVRPIKVNTSLRFLHEVLGLQRLHYGLWAGETLDRRGLRSAQERYSDHLHAWIPGGVQSVLDVGCGLGLDAEQLASRGYEVEGLSPDPYQQQHFVRRTGLPFHLVRLQDFQPVRTYDLVLMSESAQYIWLSHLFHKVKEAAPEGYLLLADYFVARPLSRKTSGHPLDAFLAAAAESGFVLERQEDLTEQVSPNLELATKWMHDHVDPAVGILVDWLESRHPVVHRLARGWLARKLESAHQDLDAERFRRDKRYVQMLFRTQSP